jgi:hypothetical protein
VRALLDHTTSSILSKFVNSSLYFFIASISFQKWYHFIGHCTESLPYFGISVTISRTTMHPSVLFVLLATSAILAAPLDAMKRDASLVSRGLGQVEIDGVPNEFEYNPGPATEKKRGLGQVEIDGVPNEFEYNPGPATERRGLGQVEIDGVPNEFEYNPGPATEKRGLGQVQIDGVPNEFEYNPGPATE